MVIFFYYTKQDLYEVLNRDEFQDLKKKVMSYYNTYALVGEKSHLTWTITRIEKKGVVVVVIIW